MQDRLLCSRHFLLDVIGTGEGIVRCHCRNPSEGHKANT